jgi:hypothetical protein
MRETDLIVGETYFMVTYADSSMRTPIIITYTYLGKDPDDVEKDEPGPHYYFRYLPAFRRHSDEEDGEGDTYAGAWASVFPNLFSGWGESVPTTFSEEKLEGFNTLAGLIDELMRARDRVAVDKTS